MAERAYEQELLRADRLEERNMGLLWLSVMTLAVLWVAGERNRCLVLLGLSGGLLHASTFAFREIFRAAGEMLHVHAEHTV